MKKLQFLLILSIIFVSSVISQTKLPPPPPLPQQEEGIIKVESRLIMVPVSITNPNGQPVLGLTTKDFQVKEENRPQEIAQVVDAEKIPLEIALLFDVSGSTDSMFKFEQQTAASFLQKVMRPEDRATIFTIGEFPTLVQNRDISYISVKTVENLKPAKKQTAFFDTVISAAKYLQNNAPPKSRKVIITISDGEDNASSGIRKGNTQAYFAVSKEINTLTNKKRVELLNKKRNKVRINEQNKTLKQLQNADTVFYSINPAGSSYKLNKISQSGQDNMQRFAGETGGTAFLPSFVPIDLKDDFQKSVNIEKNQETLENIFRKLTNELQAQYLVQYYSDSDFPANKYVNLNVGLKNPNNYRIRARKGYFVKKQ